jgi:hypothetical protein
MQAIHALASAGPSLFRVACCPVLSTVFQPQRREDGAVAAEASR